MWLRAGSGAEANMKRVNGFNRDYRIFSSTLNRGGTAIVFTAIIALAVGAFFLKSDDLAHMSVVIGVSALDSAQAAPALESFAEFCRGKGCGDIRWKYGAPGETPPGCDFYLMTSLQLSERLAGGELGCALIAASREAHRYSRSAVIVRRGVRALPPEGARIIFTSPRSAAGFLAPYRSLARSGYRLEGASIDFAGSCARDERVVFGVLYGAYDAGGISLDRLRALEASRVIGETELDVLIEGEAFPELLLAYAPSSYTAERKAFVRRLPGVHDKVTYPLRSELAGLGVAGFYAPRESDLELMRSLASMIPDCFDAAGSGGNGDR